MALKISLSLYIRANGGQLTTVPKIFAIIALIVNTMQPNFTDEIDSKPYDNIILEKAQYKQQDNM